MVAAYEEGECMLTSYLPGAEETMITKVVPPG